MTDWKKRAAEWEAGFAREVALRVRIAKQLAAAKARIAELEAKEVARG